jgi:hypothetical protein
MVDFDLINLRIGFSEAMFAYMENLIHKGLSKDTAKEIVMMAVEDVFNHISESGEMLP